MNDDFMNKLRRDPPTRLDAELREKLRRQEQEPADEAPESRRTRFYRPLQVAAAAAVVVLAFTLSPPLRASARAFLDLFRVRTFAAVSVDASRIEQLRNRNIDIKGILGDQVQELEKPAPPQAFPSVSAAGAAAGIAVRVPASLPVGLVLDTIVVHHHGVARVTADVRKLREALDALGLADVAVPPGLDGATARLRMPEAVMLRYRHEGKGAMLLQATSPEIELPAGVDIEQVGEIGLRIAGLSAVEAHRFAGTIDWRSTVLVPVPSDASSFREVEVHGERGLMITTTGTPDGAGFKGRRGAVVLWSEGSRVFALAGNITTEDLLLMANSVR